MSRGLPCFMLWHPQSEAEWGGSQSCSTHHITVPIVAWVIRVFRSKVRAHVLLPPTTVAPERLVIHAAKDILVPAEPLAKLLVST